MEAFHEESSKASEPLVRAGSGSTGILCFLAGRQKSSLVRFGCSCIIIKIFGQIRREDFGYWPEIIPVDQSALSAIFSITGICFSKQIASL